MMKVNNKIAANWIKISSDLQSQLIASEEDKIKLSTENERLQKIISNSNQTIGHLATGVDLQRDQIASLTAKNDLMREAFSGPEAWLDRWAQHVGNCGGDYACTCGLSLARAEARAALQPKEAP